MDYSTELVEARETLALSANTARRFIAQLGALNPILIPPFPGALLGKRPGTHATVLDQKYWFAKLYELISYEELRFSINTKFPGFSLHFMKIFYGMYYGALQNFDDQAIMMINPLWVTHFVGPDAEAGRKVEPDSMEAVQYSVRTGATAHIKGDMPVALATAYKSWSATPKPPFADLRDEFIDGSKSAFTAAQARFYMEVNDKIASPFSPPVGQLGAAYYQAVFNIQPALPELFQWRANAWQKAADSL